MIRYCYLGYHVLEKTKVSIFKTNLGGILWLQKDY